MMQAHNSKIISKRSERRFFLLPSKSEINTAFSRRQRNKGINPYTFNSFLKVITAKLLQKSSLTAANFQNHAIVF